MSQPKIISESPMNIYEVQDELKSIEKNDGELNFRSQRTKEYVETISQINTKKAKELKKTISDLDIPRFKEDHIAKIIDVYPISLDDLKQLVSSFNITVKEDYLKKIFELLK